MNFSPSHRSSARGGPANRTAQLLRRAVPPPAAGITLAIALVLTGVMYVHQRSQVAQINCERFAAASDDAAEALSTRLNDFALVVGGARGFVNGSELVTRDEWAQFAHDLDLSDALEGVKGIGMVQRVEADELSEFSTAARAEVYPDFSVRPVPVGATEGPGFHHVIRFFEPMESNLNAIGIDIATNPKSLPTQLRARDTGEIVLSPPTPLVRETVDAPGTRNFGVVMYAAYYEKGMPIRTVAQRRAAHAGLVVAPVFASKLVAPAFGADLTAQIAITVTEAASGQSLWSSEPVSNDGAQDAAAGLVSQRRLKHGGREWVLAFAAKPSFLVGGNAASGVGAAGLAMTLLLTALTWSLSLMYRRSSEHAAKLAERADAIEARFSAAFHGCGAGMGLTDLSGHWTSGNAALCQMLGRDIDTLLQSDLLAHAHPDDLPPIVAALGRLLTGRDRHVSLECRFLRPDGNVVWCSTSLSSVGVGVAQPDRAGGEFAPQHAGDEHAGSHAAAAPYLVVQVQDVTDRKQMELQLHHAATHDTLTGLPARPAFQDALSGCFGAGGGAGGAARTGGPAGRRGFGVLFLDLDGFKQVNDTFGHEAGDHLLRGVAGRVKTQLRGKDGGRREEEQDLPARLGGDEFVILLRGLDSPEQALAIANRLRQAIVEPYHLLGRLVNIGVSVGVATSFGGYATAEDMLRHADLAMYDAKRQGRDGSTEVLLADGTVDPATKTDAAPVGPAEARRREAA